MNHIMPLHKGDIIYVFSDGYADQFGGPDGKKFKVTHFKKMLVELANEAMHNQRNILEETIEDWRKGMMQVDDMLVIGVKIQ